MRFLSAIFLLSTVVAANTQPYQPAPYGDPYDRPPPRYDDPYGRPPPYGDPYRRPVPPPPPPVICVVRPMPPLPGAFCGTQQGPIGTSCHCRPNPFPGTKEFDRR